MEECVHVSTQLSKEEFIRRRKRPKKIVKEAKQKSWIEFGNETNYIKTRKNLFWIELKTWKRKAEGNQNSKEWKLGGIMVEALEEETVGKIKVGKIGGDDNMKASQIEEKERNRMVICD